MRIKTKSTISSSHQTRNQRQEWLALSRTRPTASLTRLPRLLLLLRLLDHFPVFCISFCKVPSFPWLCLSIEKILLFVNV